MDFRAYFEAVGLHWWPLMSCAAFTFLGVIIVALKKGPTWTLWATFGLAILMLFVASFLAWQDEHNRVASLGIQLSQKQKELDALTIPILKGSFNIRTGDIQKENSRGAVILLSGQIRNTGAPTMLHKWNLQLKFSDGKLIEGKEMVPIARTAHMTLLSHDQRTSIVYDGDQFWPIAAMSPIPTGGAAPGWIYFRIPDLTQQQIWQQHPLAVLTFEDVNGKTWSLEQKFDNPSQPDPDDFLSPDNRKNDK